MAKNKEQVLVTCEYCGGIVNILNHEFCPGCGAGFSMEQIEESRKINDKSNSDDELSEDYEYVEADDVSDRQNRKILRVVTAILVVIIVIVPICLSGYYNSRSAESSDSIVELYVGLAGDVPEGYAQVDCNLEGDNFLYRDDIIEVEITGIYYDTADENNKIFEYCIANRYTTDITAYFNLRSVNGKADESLKSMHLGGTGSSGRGEPAYSDSIRLEDEELTELVFGNVTVNGPKGETYSSVTDDNDKDFRVTVSYPSAEATSTAAEN